MAYLVFNLKEECVVIRWGIWWVCFKNLDEHEAEAWTLEGGGSLMQCDFGIKVLSRFQSGTVGFGLDSI